jgi:hypothetical protein
MPVLGWAFSSLSIKLSHSHQISLKARGLFMWKLSSFNCYFFFCNFILLLTYFFILFLFLKCNFPRLGGVICLRKAPASDSNNICRTMQTEIKTIASVNNGRAFMLCFGYGVFGSSVLSIVRLDSTLDQLLKLFNIDKAVDSRIVMGWYERHLGEGPY